MAEFNGKQVMLLGLKGDSCFIRYSASADGTDFTETRSAGQNYIGIAVGQIAPTDKSAYEWSELSSGGGGGGGVGITRSHHTGSGSITITVQDQYVYYVEGYSDITVELPDGDFTAHFYVAFPDDALTCSFNLPEGTPAFGNDLAECDFGENWEISIDSVGGALAIRKRGL